MDNLRKLQIEICKDCENKQLDLNRGMLCSLTSDLPTFSETCNDFVRIDESYKKPENRIHDGKKELTFKDRMEIGKEERNRNIEDFNKNMNSNQPNMKAIKSGASWFYFIGTLSIANSLISYFGSSFRFSFGMGITTVVEMMSSKFQVSWIGGFVSILLALFFLVLGNHSMKLEKWAFKTGIAIYFFDTIMVLIVTDWISMAFHVFGLIIMYKGFKALKEDSLIKT